MQISQTQEQIAALKSLQDKCDLESITLLSCNATRAKTGVDFTEPFSARPTLSNICNSQVGNIFIVEVSFEYSAWDSSEPSQRIFLVNCTFEVCYRINDSYSPSDSERHSFSRGTAVFNCWPYAREYFRDITSRLGHPTPVLPLLRITPKTTITKTHSENAATIPATKAALKT